MTTTYYARKDYTYTSGGGNTFTIPFSYIDEEHINVYINDVQTTNFTFNTTSQIQVTDTLTAGDVISIRRSTPIDERMVTFTNTSILSKDNQNLSAQQTFNMVQEIYDNNTTFEIKVEADIDDIEDDVDTANSTANSALATANSAISTATTALTNANSAVSTATSANTKADNAVSTANSAMSTASTAMTSATAAVTTANAADAKVDEFGEDIEDVREAAQKLSVLDEKVAQATSAASTATTAATTATNKASEAVTAASTATTQATEAKAKVGDLANLTTDAKTTTVAAINEVDSHCDTNTTNISNLKDLSNLTTTGQAILDNKLNKQQITNCILENPQNINLELSNGTLTLKAGSVVVVPNGFESDGTTPKFDEVTISSDTSMQRSTNQQEMILYNPTNGQINALWFSDIHSGSTQPTGSQFMLWYDTTNNLCKYTTDTGSTWTNYAFPIGLATSSSSAWTSLDTIFQSIGYIGSTVFIRKGLKVLIPDGRNDDGSLNNIEFTTNKVYTETLNSGWGAQKSGKIVFNTAFSNSLAPYFQNGARFNNTDTYRYKYSENDNQWYFSSDSGSTYTKIQNIILCYDVNLTSAKYDSMNIYTATNILKYSDSSQISGWGMPSQTYTSLTVGSSGSSYVAPANGWFVLVTATNTDSYARLTNGRIYTSFYQASGVTNRDLFIPVKKNDTVDLSYSGTWWSTNFDFRFVYAEGEV